MCSLILFNAQMTLFGKKSLKACDRQLLLLVTVGCFFDTAGSDCWRKRRLQGAGDVEVALPWDGQEEEYWKGVQVGGNRAL